MDDGLLSLMLIFADIGGVLLIVMIALVVRYILCAKKESKTTKKLIHHIKALIPAHRDQLVDYFKDKVEKNKSDFNIETLIRDERKIYERLIKVSITKDTTLLKLTTEDINSLINDYVRLLALKAEKETADERESRDLKLRKENEALRIENASLLTRLSISEETIENMMGEFSSMYEGGKKEGEQRLKNEMYQLKQKLDGEEAKVKSVKSKLETDADEEKET